MAKDRDLDPREFESEAEAKAEMDLFVTEMLAAAKRHGVGAIWLMASSIVGTPEDGEGGAFLIDSACRQTVIGDPRLLKGTSELLVKLVFSQQEALDEACGIERDAEDLCPDCGLPHPPAPSPKRPSFAPRRPGGWSAG